MKPKHFIAISTETIGDKLVMLQASSGHNLWNENGITFDIALDWLFDLIHLRQTDRTTVFVCYAFSRDNEFIFSTMPRALKDKLFRSQIVQKQVDSLLLENESLDEQRFYSVDPLSYETQKADFERTCNSYALQDLLEVKHGEYDIKLANGKSLIIKRRGKVITFYDVFGFFKPQSLRLAIHKWFDIDLAGLDRNELRRTSLSEKDILKTHALIESTAVAKLATKLNQQLQSKEINLTRYHGATAITSHWLGKSAAKSDFHNYRYRRQLSPELHKAVRQSYYGGRAEQFKLGTFYNVYVFDINSAYAFACTHLPKLLRKPTYTKTWSSDPFSLWFCEYDLTGVNDCHIGILPNRDANNFTRYKLRGSGYFWQPEIMYIAEHYPQCINIKGGFVFDQTPAGFGKDIETIYNVRLELKRRGDPLEKVFKLALASLYGKFAQHNGKGHYYNLFYAGFITSFTRAQMLHATRGIENEIISYQTDAIHTQCETLCNASLDDDLGSFNRKFFNSVTYLDNGVYSARDNISGNGYQVATVNKTRGVRQLDFEQALSEIKDKKQYTACVDFFVGHNLISNDMFGARERMRYLDQHQITKINSPLANDRSAMRLFDALDIDLATDNVNSKPLNTYSGRESLPYMQQNYKQIDMAMDTIEAGRI